MQSGRQAPLGPFAKQRRNPILIAGEGVVNGTAHHSIVEGPGKTLWCFYTTRVRNEANCERRIGMDPAGIDENGELFVAGPTETPQYAPGLRPDPARENGTGLAPLSVDCWATASSSSEGRDPVYAVDNSVNTWWQAAGEPPQWLEVDLRGEYLIHSARTMFADRGLDYKAGVVPAPYRYRILGSRDDKTWELLCDKSANAEERHIVLDRFTPAWCRRALLEILAVPPGMKTAVWEFTVFGWPQGDEPAACAGQPVKE